MGFIVLNIKMEKETDLEWLENWYRFNLSLGFVSAYIRENPNDTDDDKLNNWVENRIKTISKKQLENLIFIEEHIKTILNDSNLGIVGRLQKMYAYLKELDIIRKQ